MKYLALLLPILASCSHTWPDSNQTFYEYPSHAVYAKVRPAEAGGYEVKTGTQSFTIPTQDVLQLYLNLKDAAARAAAATCDAEMTEMFQGEFMMYGHFTCRT